MVLETCRELVSIAGVDKCCSKKVRSFIVVLACYILFCFVARVFLLFASLGGTLFGSLWWWQRLACCEWHSWRWEEIKTVAKERGYSMLLQSYMDFIW